jgi:DNA invertase Pin-like site-specific DNA recombinase
MPKDKSTEPRVYSYLRFSTPEQAQGDSERRQLQAAQDYAQRNGLELDDSLRLADRGLSAYKGDHRTKGALGQYLDLVKAGDVPAGSVLVVENIDRLSREGVVEALGETVLALVKRGITIEAISPPGTYNRESLNGGRIYELIAHLARAHDESKRKSDLIRAVQEAKRKQARAGKAIVTRRIPSWLRVTGDGRFEVIPDAAEAVRLIYRLRLEGLGLPAIERRLNAEAAWQPPLRKGQRTKGWRQSYVKKILRNPAVIGVYQPYTRTQATGGKRLPAGEAIAGYYPAIIKPDVFHQIAAKMEANRGKGGRTGKVRSLLTYLVKCAYCGSPMALFTWGHSHEKGVAGCAYYLVCDRARRGLGCNRASIRYDEVEDLLLANCEQLKPAQVLPNCDRQAQLCRELTQRLRGKEAERDDLERKIANVIDQIAATDDAGIRARYEDKARQLQDAKAAAGKELAEAAAELARAELSSRSFVAWKKDLAELRQALATGAPDIRLRLRAHLRQFIDRIEVFTVGFARRYDQHRDGDPPPDDVESIGEYMEDGFGEDPANRAFIRSKRFKQFVEYAVARRMSKDGRFIRVRFKTDGAVDLVPPGSLATGEVLVTEGRAAGQYRFTGGPPVSRLWKEFEAKYPEKQPRAERALNRG